MNHDIEFEQETDGRWIAEIPSLPSVMAYGSTKEEAATKVEALAETVGKETTDQLAWRIGGEMIKNLRRNVAEDKRRRGE